MARGDAQTSFATVKSATTIQQTRFPLCWCIDNKVYSLCVDLIHYPTAVIVREIGNSHLYLCVHSRAVTGFVGLVVSGLVYVSLLLGTNPQR